FRLLRAGTARAPTAFLKQALRGPPGEGHCQSRCRARCPRCAARRSSRREEAHFPATREIRASSRRLLQILHRPPADFVTSHAPPPHGLVSMFAFGLHLRVSSVSTIHASHR